LVGLLEAGMNNEEIRNWYLDLPDPQKQIFLAVLSNKLTIHGAHLDLISKEKSKPKPLRVE